MTVVPLNGSNYPTWKVQCRMALMKEGVWNIVNGLERPPSTSEESQYAKFASRRDRALATIVLSVDPSLLYLIGDPEDPIIVWKKLADQFQKKTWANKLELRRKLYSLRLRDGDPVQDHIKTMTETFNGLSVIGDPVSEEDRVVYLLASLPDSYSMLVTAFEANTDVPKMEVVTERLLHEERKLKERAGSGAYREEAMAVKQQRQKGPRCYHCGKFGHIKRNCDRYAEAEERMDSRPERKSFKQKANQVEVRRGDSSNSDNESIGLLVREALSAGSGQTWIVDSGATCHMCNNKKMFTNFTSLKQPLEVALGDGHVLQAVGRGIVALVTELSDKKTKKCNLHDVLYVPKLSYNLLSVSKATEDGKMTKFVEDGCQVLDANEKLIAVGKKVGSLYYLDCRSGRQWTNTAKSRSHETRENVWHRRYGHLGAQSLQKLAKHQLVDGFDFNAFKEIDFCESCAEGKHHRSQFSTSGGKLSQEPLDLVHSDVCGKMSSKSLSGAEYFMTLIDDKTRYVWVYVLKRKDQVFEKFREWKALVEKSTGRTLKALRTDNGGEYTSAEFEKYLKSEGVRHERTVPKTPEQNGVAERMNRTLIEMVRSMLAGAKLPQKFWAEALSTAAYLRNRSPTKAVVGKTPFEAWTGEKPRVDHLRTFGCVAYAHIAKDERRKLDSKARRCIFLGYGTETRGYRLYDPERERVFFSRDVLFNESEHGIEKESNQQEEQPYVEIDCPVDENSSDQESIVAANDQEASVDRDRESSDDEPTQPVLRRSQRERQPCEYYGHWATVADAEPATVKKALTSTDQEKWQNAMEAEIKSLEANDVWDLVELPKDRKAVGSKWVFKLKVDADGSVERYKARLVAQGFSQKLGLDYDETFSPVVRFESVRTVIALAVQNGLKLHQLDVTTAFLNGELQEEVYMKQPECFVAKGQEHLVCRLKRSIYGLKQSPRCWNSALHSQLKKMGFVQTASDPCLYISSEGEMLIVAVYVDDILVAGKSEKQVAEVKKALAKQFKIKDMGKLHYFLGVKVVQDEAGVWIGQPAYAESILQRFGMDHAKPVNTPVETSSNLVKSMEGCDNTDPQEYQSAVGSLLYLSTRTRPDITYAVSNVARFCGAPSKQHWTAVKRILRYLKGTQGLGLLYTKDGPQECIGYSDSDWAGDIGDRKSTSGYMFQMSGAAVTWRSKKQTCVALSTAEAEYIALASATQEAMWLRQLTTDLRMGPDRSMLIFEDNQSAICMASNPQFHGRAKHIDIKYHFVREQVKSGIVELKYCPSDEMIADMLTKGLSWNKFVKLRDMAGLHEHSA